MYRSTFMNFLLSVACMFLTLLFSANIVSAQESCLSLFKTRPQLTVLTNYDRILLDLLQPKTGAEKQIDIQKIAKDNQLAKLLQEQLKEQLLSKNTSAIHSETAARLSYGLNLLAELQPDVAVYLSLQYLNADKIKTHFFSSKVLKNYVSELDRNISYLVIYNLLKKNISPSSFLAIIQTTNRYSTVFRDLINSTDVRESMSHQLSQLRKANTYISTENLNIIQATVSEYFETQLQHLYESKNLIFMDNTQLYLYRKDWSIAMTMAFNLKAIAVKNQSQTYIYFDQVLEKLFDTRIYRNNRQLLPAEVRDSLDAKLLLQNVIQTITESNG